jgi:hypothetical protein
MRCWKENFLQTTKEISGTRGYGIGCYGGAFLILLVESRQLFYFHHGKFICNVWRKYWAMGWMTGVYFPAGTMLGFLFATASRPGLGPIQTPIQWVPGVLTPGVQHQDMKLTTSSSCRGYESMELYLHYRKSSSRRGAQLCRGTQLNTW